jgi:hypothetical protein
VSVHLRHLVSGALAIACSIPGATLFAQQPGLPVTVTPGALVRWTAPGTTQCTMMGRTWAAVQETCYYPVDILQKPTIVAIARVCRSACRPSHCPRASPSA